MRAGAVSPGHGTAVFSVVNMTVSKSDLDLHLSESDWCGLVVQFGPVYAQNLVKKL